MTSQTLERSQGLEKLNEAMEKIKVDIEKAGGVFTVKRAVCIRIVCCSREGTNITRNFGPWTIVATWDLSDVP